VPSVADEEADIITYGLSIIRIHPTQAGFLIMNWMADPIV